MQNNVDDINYKALEDAGWAKVKSQLDIEMPENKKERRLIIWWFLGAIVLGFVVYHLINKSFLHSQTTAPKVEILKNKDQHQAIPNLESKEEPPITINSAHNTEVAQIQSSSLSKHEKAEKWNTTNKNPIQKSDELKKLIPNALKADTQLDASLLGESKDNHLSKEWFVAKNTKNTSRQKQPIEFKSTNSDTKNEDKKLWANEHVVADDSMNEDTKGSTPESKKNLSNHRSSNTTLAKQKSFIADPLNTTWSELFFNRSMHVNTNNTTPSDFIEIASSQNISAKNNFIVDAGLEYGLGSGSNHNSFFTQSTSIGYQYHLHSKFYLLGNAGVAFPFSNESLYLNNNGQLSADNSTGTNFDPANKSNGATSSPTIVAIEKIVLDPTRSITSVSNNVLYITKNDKVRVNSAGSVQYDLNLKLGYHLNRKLFVESGLGLRDEIINKVTSVTVISQSQSVGTNAFNAQSYEFSLLKRQARLRLIGSAGFTFFRNWQLATTFHIPTLNTGNILFPASSSNPQTIPLNNANEIKLPIVNEWKAGISIRYTFR